MERIIICGHYGCERLKAALTEDQAAQFEHESLRIPLLIFDLFSPIVSVMDCLDGHENNGMRSPFQRK